MRSAWPKAPPGFKVELVADGLAAPRLVRAAPNGDIFVSETAAGRLRVFKADGSGARGGAVYASGLDAPFGIAFYPPGPEPRFLYVANTNAVVRFPYRSGDVAARAGSEPIVARLTREPGGHSTRDVVFSPDGARMLVSVGSESNAGEGMPRRDPALAAADAALGASWGDEEGRAAVLAFTPEGRSRKIFATGLRNCVGLAVQPATGDLWCSTNERDGLGDDLVPDYVTRVKEGAFYGWPWFYLGANEDPRHRGARPDLRDRVTVPDVLLQPHSASLQMTFDTGSGFPPAYRDSAYSALHGSWNRAKRTGYKIVRMPLKDGVPTGEYEDFLTGFVAGDRSVWGRPVGVTFGRDGAMYVTDDANGSLWRVSWVGTGGG